MPLKTVWQKVESRVKYPPAYLLKLPLFLRIIDLNIDFTLLVIMAIISTFIAALV